MARLGKRERALRKDQWKVYREAKTALIADNKLHLKDMPTSRGFRLSPDPNEGYTFHGASNMKRPDNLGRDQGFAKSKY